MAGDLLYAKTQRIVLLIDLNPLLVKSNSEQYLAVVISAAEKLLSFPPLSASLFSFKFFFSSLSSLLSSSKLSALSISSSSLSFDLPNPTLVSLRRALAAVKRCELRSASTAALPPRGVNVSASLRQIVYDYAWEPVVQDPEIGMIPGFTDGGLEIVRSNLVVMFSPISRDLKWVSEFLDVKTGDECLSELDLFKSKLGEIFDCVNDLFDSRDILLSWIDVKSGERSELGLKSEFFDSGIRELGWGHCSTDSIVFGTSIVPFGLIYPTIGIRPKLFTSQKFTVQSSLEIADINGRPMECKCGELEFSLSEIFSGKTCDEFINLASAAEEPLTEEFRRGITKLSIKALRMCDVVELERYACDTFVVHEVYQESDQDQEQESGFWADRVLQVLEKETGEKVAKKSSPIWQILLSYLYREGYSALVSLTNSNGSSRTGILKPFTFSTGLICVFDSEVSPQTVDHEDSGNEVNCSEDTRKVSKKILNSLRAISWEEFCRSVKDYGQINIEDVYVSKFSKSKKFKFLKCWTKQIRQPRGCSLSVVASNCDAQENVEADPIEKTHNSSEEKEKAVSLPVSEEDIALSGNRISVRHENETSVYASESSESFFVNLPSKIKQGIESEEIDLAALAERLVKSCLLHSSQRLEKDYSCENGTLLLVTEELTKMLLKEPKDLVAKFKKKDSSSMASEQKSDEAGPSSIIREYELQILFRMEILRSEIGLGSEESVQKFAKQICMLLEAIQCELDGGFFGDWSLDKYVDKIIKARYHHVLGEAVNIIYTEMDLLMFSDEDLEDSFMNNEDSSQSGRENIHSNLKSHHRSRRGKDVPSTSKKTLLQKKECREAKKEVQAQERRERARRFSSFTSWMPDLCRVWAPKQAKNSKDKADHQKRMAKRKKDERSVEYDKVCETPVTTDSKRTRTDDKDEYECGTRPRSSVPKALFQDDL